MAVSQQDIADRLQLSRATISRSLNNAPGIDPQTRTKVLELATKLGYPMGLRRQGRHAEHRIIGVLVGNPGGKFPRQPFQEVGAGYLAGMSEALEGNNLHLDVRYIEPEQMHQLIEPGHQPQPIAQQTWAGMLLIYSFPHEVIRELIRTIPCVSVVNHYDDLPVDCVDADQERAIFKLVTRLHAAGHRRIGFIGTGRRQPLDYEYRRFAGFVEAMARLRMAYHPQWTLGMHGEPMDADRRVDCVDDLREQGVTAWVCVTDRIGYETMHYLDRRGIRVPDDLSFVGYDCIEPPLGSPPLVSVTPSLKEVGAAAVKTLLERLEMPESPRHTTMFDCTVSDGETVAPPPH